MITAATTRIVTAIREIKLPPEVLRIVEDYYGLHPRDILIHNIRMSRVMLTIKDMGEFVDEMGLGSVIANRQDYARELKAAAYDMLKDETINTDFLYHDYVFEMTKRKQYKTKWGKVDLLRNRIASVVSQIDEHMANPNPTQAWVVDYLENQLTELKAELAAI